MFTLLKSDWSLLVIVLCCNENWLWAGDNKKEDQEHHVLETKEQNTQSVCVAVCVC